MAFNPKNHHRKSIRLLEYDYSRNGYYFITICTCQKLPLFGEIIDGNAMLNDLGKIAKNEWQKVNILRPSIKLDEYIFMPNHMHGILIMDHPVGARFIAPKSGLVSEPKGAINCAPTIGSIIREYKARCTHAINGKREMRGTPVWQRNYYERIVRNDKELINIREYIRNNPAQWKLDELYMA